VQVALKIWRYDSSTGERALKEYEITAPEEATLLDCLDIVKDRHDGSLAYRKSCRMMICGSCGMRMDGAAVLACKIRMHDIAQEGRIPVISAMGNLPIVKDLVVDMDPFWSKFKAMKPYLQPGYDRPEDGKEYRISQERMNVIHKEALCINCGCCVSECNAMESDPEFLGPQALAKGMRFVGDPRDGATVERLEQYSGPHGIWECTRCFFCNERCPKGVDPRDAIAKLGAEAIAHGIDRDMGAKHAKWFIRSTETTGWLRETELVPKTQGVVSSVKQMKFAMGLIKHNKAGIAFPPHVARDVKEARNLRKVVQAQDRQGALGHVQGERALARLAHGHHGEHTLDEIYDRPGAYARPYLPGEETSAAEPPTPTGKTAAPSAPLGEGSAGGQGSLTQADVTPGEEPTKKPGGGA
jgi:succinate dehydrogenase / fumarate reductase iron-sulfur subunit